ncbi:protein kinase domain-containing protein [Streptomyces longisporus]|uniref:non-specific serine/threonine protein kinase n=1 Tax=Streptomyces longisporus TaxID=1948 RepID=A0ABN3MH20_STRLO
MGRVWRAADEMLDRPVAVKEMRIDGLDAEDTRTRRERTLREARATARIDHPHVVRVYDVVDEGERLWIVMELVVGRSLERIMVEEGPLGPGETARIGLGLVAALRQVHARGVLHRDIKPGNVLVEDSGRRVVLTDFGIAAIQDAKALTMVGMLVGSPDYMAPERISGRPQGPPSDVWSLGATLCAALGGRSPFSRGTTLATLHAVLYEEPELPAAAGPLRDVLAALLEKEPAVRPALPDLEEALRRVAYPADAEEPSESQEPPGTEPVEGAGPSPTGAEAEPEPEQPGGADASNERPTPVYLDTRLMRAARDPRRPAPALIEDAVPQEPPDTYEFRRERPSAPSPEARSIPSAPPVPVQFPNASTEVPSELRSEARSETSAADPAHRNGSDGPHRSRHRAVLVAVGALVAAGAVVAVFLLTNSGSSGGGHAGSSTAATTSVTTSADSPSPTVEGTSRPQSLPPGAHREAGGFAWAPPQGWRRDLKTGAEVHYTSPDGTQELVAKSSLARGDLMEAWQKSEQDAHQGQDYRKIRLERTTFRGNPAVVWEYTFTMKGTPWHARLLGFDQDGKSYQINTWYQPETETQALKTYDSVKDGFTVL